MREERRRVCPGLLLTGCLLWVLAFAACSATMPPVRMNVVDEQDGRPVAGALALFHASAHEGTFTGHGGRQVNLFVAEGVTDESGELSRSS